MTGWVLAIVIFLVYMLGVCSGVFIFALIAANGRDRDD